jgi:hypothetical protein
LATLAPFTQVHCPLDSTRFTDDPVSNELPAAGLSLITSPEGTVLLEAVVTVPTTSPAPLIAAVAAACVSPTTFGTVTPVGPIDTARFTDDPVTTVVPADGLSLITSPEGTVLLKAVVTVPTISPAPVITVVAAACVSPTTFGTARVGRPVDTTTFTDDPVTTVVPATGLSLITSPEGTVLLEAVVTVPTTSPARMIAVVATACVSPTTFGTVKEGSYSHRSLRYPAVDEE